MQRLAAFPAAPRLSILASIAAILFLSACAFDPSTIVRTPRTPEAAEAGAKGSDAQPGDAGTKAAQELPPEVTDAFEKPEQIAAVEIDLTNFKERLLGLDDQEITELLGKPKFERNEPPARIWQYQSNECFVDLFLFSQDGDITVDHVEVRGKQVEKIDENVCFASILNAANGGEAPAKPVGPLAPQQPAPGAVKVPPVTQGIPSDEGGEEIAPPSLMSLLLPPAAIRKSPHLEPKNLPMGRRRAMYPRIKSRQNLSQRSQL